MEKEHLEQLRETAQRLGAVEATEIDPSDVVTAPWVRLKCQYGCAGYGRSLTCPPHSPTPEQTRAVLDGYSEALLVHGDGNTDIHKVVVALEREAFLLGYYKAFGMGAGPCQLCAECAGAHGCRHGDEARPSMEACGIDVFETVRSQDLAIEVLSSTECQGNYYGLVLIE